MSMHIVSTIVTMWPDVYNVSRWRLNIDIQQDYYSHTLFPNRNGRSFWWISLLDCHYRQGDMTWFFVVVKTLTKSAHFIPMRTTYQAPDIARVFISEMVRLHGVPERIIYNQGSMFTGWFGIVSKRPWEPNLTLVLCITHRRTGRLNERTRPWKTCCTCT